MKAQPKSTIFASWVVIWFGTVLSVSASEPMRNVGFSLWVAGVALQLAIAYAFMRHLRLRVLVFDRGPGPTR